MLARPKPGESEEDILAMQEAYLAEREKNKDFAPSAKVVNLRKHKSDQSSEGSPKQSKHDEESKLKKNSKVSFNDKPSVLGGVESDTEMKESVSNVDDNVYYPSIISSVMGEIVEKNLNTQPLKKEKLSLFASGGFPAAKKRDKNISVSGTKSIFAQQIKSNKLTEVLENKQGIINDSEMEDCSKSVHTSVILQGEDADAIHNENLAVLGRMTEQEIMEEKEKLAAMIDPGILDYIKSLRKNKTPVKKKQNEIKSASQTKVVKNEPFVKMESFSDVINHPNSRNWMHFDIIEQDKLQWIQNMENIDLKPTDKPYEARFDFKGFLLPYSMEYTEETKTLFHHGEEPHRPGYTLNELFQLTRSTVTQQRALALNTIAGILEYDSLQIYKDIIDIPITKAYFVLRFALDENISIVLEPTLKALRNIFYNRIDEACLDFLLGSENGLLQPRLLSKKFANEDTDSDVSELKDFHLVDLDLTSGAVRTDILTRFKYILHTVKPTLTCVEYCLQILTRIARDTLENAEAIFKTDGLIDCLFNCIPTFLSTFNATKSDVEFCKIILVALKLVRILAGQSKHIAEEFFSKYNIIERLKNYIGNTITENTFILKIQIESLYLWSTFLSYGFGLNQFMDLQCVFLRVLDNHVKGTENNTSFPVIMHSHCAAIVTLLNNARLASSQASTISSANVFSNFHQIIILGIQKWTSQVCTLENYTAGHLKSLTALFIHLNLILQMDYDQIRNSLDILNSFIKKMLSSPGFSKITANLRNCSNLLYTNAVKDKIESSIPGLNSSVMSTAHDFLPTLRSSSPICFLSSLTKYIYASKNKDLALSFIQNRNILDYIASLNSSRHLSLADNWFTKIELDILCNCVCFSTNLEFSDEVKELLYNFAFKLTYVLSPEYRSQLEYILKHIVFNKSWFTTERLLRNLNISETDNILNHLDAIFQTYSTVLKINYKSDTLSLTVSHWDEKILPRDWMFLPILGLYTKSQDPEESNIPKCLLKTKEEIIKNVVTCSLEWILVSELYFPEITDEIGLTDRFCRLSCVFLCDNSLFLDATIKSLLQKCMKIIFDIENSQTTQNKLNFDKSLLGINNFQDLYTQLVDQFQAVSYGDPSYAACVLVPLMQRHNIKWRKLVWSEYAACLRALDCPEEDLCYRIDEYLEPPEMDFSLLKSYHRALISNLVRPGTIAFKIAQKHVESAQNRQRASKMAKNTNQADC